MFLSNLKEEHKSIIYFKNSVNKSKNEAKGKYMLSLAATYEHFVKTDKEIVINFYNFKKHLKKKTTSIFPGQSYKLLQRFYRVVIQEKLASL